MPAGILDPLAIYSMRSTVAPAGLILEASSHGKAVTQRILYQPARGCEETFKDRPIEVTGCDASPCEPVLGLSVQRPNV